MHFSSGSNGKQAAYVNKFIGIILNS